MCSTPCGITDSFTRTLDEMDNVTQVCSTPCGITDSFTLAALEPLEGAGMCSTPCGITDSFTWMAEIKEVRDRVLNALRHHG